MPEKLSHLAEPSAQNSPHYFHTVRWPEETLAIISEWYTGDLENWRILAKANPEVDPDSISVGTQIGIPRNLLHTEKSMPSDFLSALLKRDGPETGETINFDGSSPDAAPDQKSAYYSHTVRWRGETLSIIAKWYTGNGENWRALTQANPELDPHRIAIGNRILIPPQLLQTHEPLPPNVLADYTPATTINRGQAASSQADTKAKDNQRPMITESPTKVGGFELFGPR